MTIKIPLVTRRIHIILFIYLIIWFVINILFLTDFPFVHTDELWLSGLSRSMMEDKSPAATEDFFDLYERNPHAIKILFHTVQTATIGVLGYSLKTVRLISLFAGLFSLLLMYRLIDRVLSDPQRKTIALITTIWLSLDVQFLYVSHFARQEIFMILLLLIMLNIALSTNRRAIQRGFLTGAVLGLSAGFHPNSFIIAWPVGLFLLVEVLQKKRKIHEGAVFLLSSALMTLIFVAISFHFNPDFIQDYRSYGDPLGVLDETDVKLLRLPGFYGKLFHQISGTYYTPDIRLQMIVFPIILIVLVLKKRGKIALTGFIGFNIGLVIIGKYSQPSISFLLPFYYLVWGQLMEFRPLRFVIPLLMTATLIFSVIEISGEKERFSDYTAQLNELIPSDSTALGNLYCEFALADGQFYDWRNLPLLRENNQTLGDYIRERKIEYIILSEELSFIYENRPYWNVLYGNLAHWYPDLIEFTEKYCSVTGEFESPGYGMRITAYRYRQPWFVKIYKVNYRESIIE